MMVKKRNLSPLQETTTGWRYQIIISRIMFLFHCRMRKCRFKTCRSGFDVGKNNEIVVTHRLVS